MFLSDKVYNTIKWIAQYLLPALGTLYFALAKLWGLPYSNEIVGTISAVDVFLGAILGISSLNYKGDGDLVLNAGEPSDVVLNYDPNDIANKGRITLNVVKE